MSESLINSIVVVLTAIVGVAILAVLVSRNANTAGVLTAGGNAFATALKAATGPVSGGGIGGFPDFTYNGSGLNP